MRQSSSGEGAATNYSVLRDPTDDTEGRDLVLGHEGGGGGKPCCTRGRCLLCVFASLALLGGAAVAVWLLYFHRAPVTFPTGECSAPMSRECPYSAQSRRTGIRAGHGATLATNALSFLGFLATPAASPSLSHGPAVTYRDETTVGLCWPAVETSLDAAGNITYQVEASDWFYGGWDVAYEGAAHEAGNLTAPKVRLFPGTNVSFRARVAVVPAESQALTFGAWSPITTLLVPPCGRCANQNDAHIVKTQRAVIKTKLRPCVEGCRGADPVPCAAPCLSKALNFTYNCSVCWVDRAVCTINHCLSKCIAAPTSPECFGCQSQVSIVCRTATLGGH